MRAFSPGEISLSSVFIDASGAGNERFERRRPTSSSSCEKRLATSGPWKRSRFPTCFSNFGVLVSEIEIGGIELHPTKASRSLRN